MTAKSIVVSGPPAIGKTTLARTLASDLGMRHVSGGDVLKEMAKSLGYDPSGNDWWDTEEGMKFLRERERDHDFDRKLDERLLRMFEGGNVVVTSYTLPWLAGPNSSGIKVWLDGSHASSISRMQSRDSVSTQKAYRITRERYDRNRALYKRIYGFEFGSDMSVFDHIIQTDNLTAEQVVDAVKGAISKVWRQERMIRPDAQSSDIAGEEEEEKNRNATRTEPRRAFVQGGAC